MCADCELEYAMTDLSLETARDATKDVRAELAAPLLSCDGATRRGVSAVSPVRLYRRAGQVKGNVYRK